MQPNYCNFFSLYAGLKKIVCLRMQLLEVIRQSLDRHPVYEWCSHLSLML